LIVVSDTSPILNLQRIGRLDLLPGIYQKVLIPPAVATELARYSISVNDAQYGAWLSVAEPQDRILVRNLCGDLDIGEAESIVLAIERQATLLLMDEKLGRQIAERHGVLVTGLIGVLVAAKEVALIQRVGPLLDELAAKARFWIHPELHRRVLAELDE
jgi:uncharacterized protein